MNEDLSAPGVHAERIDADAVCAKCGTVNPEETLLCKTCGNNLRDQRTQRIAAGGTAEIAIEGRSLRSMASVVLVVVGILFILGAALYQDSLFTWYFDSQAAAYGDIEGMWKGPRSAPFEGLRRQMRAKPVTEEEIRANLEQPVLPSDNYSGRYFLMSPGSESSGQPVGFAYVSHQGERMRILATLTGGVEIRSVSHIESERFPFAPPELTGVRMGDEFYGGFGIAIPSGDTFEVNADFGVDAESEQRYIVTAYWVP